MANNFNTGQETNLFRADLPAADEISGTLREFLDNQMRQLRDFAEKVQTGSAVIPASQLTLRSSTQLYPLGSEARASIATGILRARFVQFLYDSDTANLGKFVYGAAYQVAIAGDPSSFLGIDFTNSGTGSYGWVVTEGMLEASFFDLTPFAIGTLLTPSGQTVVADGSYPRVSKVDATNFYLTSAPKSKSAPASGSELATLTARVDAQDAKLAAFQTSVTTMSEQIAALDSAMAANYNNLLRSVERINSTNLDSTLTDLAKKIESVEFSLASQSGRLDGYDELYSSNSLTIQQMLTAAQQANQAAQAVAQISQAQAILVQRALAGAQVAQMEAVQAASLVVGYAPSAINANPLFTDWPITGIVPTGWDYRNASFFSRVPRVIGSGSAVGIDMSTPTDASLEQYDAAFRSPVTPNAYYVVEIDYWLRGGTPGTSGFWVAAFPDSGVSSGDAAYTGATDLAVGVVNRIRQLFQVSSTTNFVGPYCRLGAGNQYAIERWLIRPASDAEILAGSAIPGIEASVSTLEGAVATLGGKTEAYLVNQVIAGSSEARVSLHAQNDAGGAASAIELIADSISLGVPGNKVLEVTDGLVRVNGALNASGGMFIGGGSDTWPVALKAKDWIVTDGTAVSYGIDLQSIPIVDFSSLGLAPLGTGETYSLYADALNSTGFTARLKINTPGSSTTYSLNTDSAGPGTPNRQIGIGSNPESSTYTYTVGAGASIIDGTMPADGDVQFDFYTYDGSVWTYLQTTHVAYKAPISGVNPGSYTRGSLITPTVAPGTIAFGVSVSATSGGVSRTVGAQYLNKLEWTHTTSSSTRTATPGGETCRVTVRPQ